MSTPPTLQVTLPLYLRGDGGGTVRYHMLRKSQTPASTQITTISKPTPSCYTLDALPPNQRAKAGDRSINALNGKFYHGQTLMKQVTAAIYFFKNGVKLHVTINSVKSTQVNDYYITVKIHGNKYNH